MAEEKKKKSDKVTKLVEAVSELSVLELSELVSALQEKLGVTPQAVAAAPATGQGAMPSGEAQGAQAPSGVPIQTVVMTASGSNKIAVIKALREINQNLSLMDAKAMTENIPAEVLKDVKSEDAKGASEKLIAAGATVEVK